jgi:hypothetical protein
MVWPVPVGPVSTTRPAKQSITGRARATSASEPPTITSSVPSSASLGVRDSGASISVMPFSLSCAASRIVTEGSEVEQSTIISGLPAEASPSGPLMIASTSGLPVTQIMTMSLPSASALALLASVAPFDCRLSTGVRLRWPRTVRGKPFWTMFLAIPCPISPRPTKPIFSLLMFPLRFPGDRGGR